MELKTQRETIYGGPLARGTRKAYFVYLRGQRIGHGDTKEAAQAAARQTLADAHEYLTRSCIARLAQDGTIIVFRQLSADTAMYEFCRDGAAGSSTCMGRMTDGLSTFRTLREYADHTVAQYDGCTAPTAQEVQS
jgi:hypothetical protein